jgi:hypothetical protein
MAPVVRSMSGGGRQAINMRCGFPPPNIPGSKPRNPYGLLKSGEYVCVFFLKFLV